MYKKSFINLVIICLYSIYCYHTYQEFKIPKSKRIVTQTNRINGIQRNIEETPIGNIKIAKINLNQKIYSKNSPLNNIEQNITILKESILPENKDSIIFLAAHSGYGDIAYFNRLDELTFGDNIFLTYKDKKLIYEVNNIEEQTKTGKIKVAKNKEKELILTTCSKKDKNKQLIITSKIK